MWKWQRDEPQTEGQCRKDVTMGDKPISFKDKNGNFVSAADVWTAEKLEELFNTLNPNRKFRLEREKAMKENQ